MAASTSTAANPNNSYDYDVFINHGGLDTKKTFASYLYRRLLLSGLRVFLDSKELQAGHNLSSQIERAIKAASVQVAIFSPGYAASKWCLDELLLMLETGTTILPVFYNVYPSELRKTGPISAGIYAQALHRHEDNLRCDPIIIENWRKALSTVSYISGFDLRAYNGDEGELLDSVVERVLQIVEKPTENVARYLAGLDEKVKDFENEVKCQVVGIVGLGGLGKTTLANELFNRKKLHYSRACFLNSVRENAGTGSLTSLQSQLLKSLTGEDVLIDRIDKGKEELKKHLSSYRVLVILDDVDHLDQIEALLPVRTDLLSDSLIVITSRDIEVIRSSGASIYKLAGLNEQHSRELFCAYAFNHPYPRPGFECMVENYLKACDGLPLSLKIFGAHLNGKYDPSEWKVLLDELQKFLPSEIQERFQISYRSLNMQQQQIFLDSACFFIGQKRDTAIRIWNGSGWEGRMGFQILENRCLLEVDSENNIRMHDHLRDFGRAAAEALLPRRLWHCTTINDMLEKLSVATVRGIRMGFNEYNDDEDAFGGIDMSRLQLVDTENAIILERILRRSMHLPSLIWLRWKKCSERSLPAWILMESLSVLQVSGSQLNTLWAEWQAPSQLRELEIYAPLCSIPESIWRLRVLERMVVGRFLSGQVNLTKLPEEFCRLQYLKDLVLTECSKLKSLPDSFGCLQNLQHVDLSFCRNLERLPDSFGDLWRIRHINLSDCHDLERLPNSINQLRRLQHIDLRGCHNLEILPDTFGNLQDLRHINLSGCHDLKRLLNSFGNLRRLQHIDLQRCHNLKELPNSFGDLYNLEHINLSNCRGIERLPDSFGNLTNLQYIDLSGCHNLERLPNYFRNLNKLKYLDVEGCSNLIIETIEISGHLPAAHQKHLEELHCCSDAHQSLKLSWYRKKAARFFCQF